MCKPHKHAAIIKAWADGAEIEWRCREDRSWIHLNTPVWNENEYYRIKPAKKSAGELLREAYYSINAANMHWESLTKDTRMYYEKSAIAFLEAWKKENE